MKFLCLTLVLFIFSADSGWAYPSLGSTTSKEEKESATSESRFLSNIHQATLTGKRAGEGYFNSDGTLMVFQSERDSENPFYQIFLMDLLTGETTRVSPGSGKTTCSWIHPTEKKILFASTHQDPEAVKKQEEEIDLRLSGKERRYSWDYDENYDIFEADFEGNILNKLTDALGYDAEGSWSPDGSSIVFASNRHAYSEELSDADRQKFALDKSYMMDLYKMDADGSNVKRLTDVKGYDGGPFFSPDGKQICWRRFSEDGATAEIWLMDSDGSNQRQITHLGAMSWAPYFHPSGDYLIFTTNKHGFANFELYLVDTEGKSEPVRVTTTDGFDGLPVFFPDGNRLAWTSNRTANNTSQIFFADWNDARARELLGLKPAVETVTKTEKGSENEKTELLDTIDVQDLRQHIEYLASEELEGRMTGTMGEKFATKYAETVFKSLGLEPAGDNGTFYQEFEFTAGVNLGENNSMKIAAGEETQDLEVDKDWRPLAFSRQVDNASGEVVFAGYGLVAPGQEEFEDYDSFVHLDVKGKWVLVFRFMPEDIGSEMRQHLLRFSSPRYKAMLLRGKGAKGVIFVSGPTSQVKNQLMTLSPDASFSGSGIPALSITDEVAQSLLDKAGKNLEELQKSLDTGEPSMGFSIPDVRITTTIELESEKRTGRNVLARLPAGAQPTESMIAIGAHIDHLGRGLGGNSLAKDDEEGKVHYGADDNASGSAALLEIAEYLTRLKESGAVDFKHDILFTAWSGEELGLLGSANYVSALSESIGSATQIYPTIAAYLNMDMVGRFKDKLVLQGFGSSPEWSELVEKANIPIGIPITTSNDSYLPTDATSFYLKGVPILAAFTGVHEDYHTPRDTPDKIDYEDTARIARLMGLIAADLAEQDSPPEYVEMKKPENMDTRAEMRAYLGTIPDYSQGDIKGVKLSGVAKGGPADKGGIQGGDIIIKAAGKNIENIYDYTFAIEAMKIGDPVEIVVKRGDKEVPLEVTPESRQ
ncbi:MAG: M28 family peptidase [Candidatus Omnitrophica bacterium]|nr:M28 family peptidase [Candidatus Omnitrophota bacterium]